VVTLPTYPWQRERYWVKRKARASANTAALLNVGGHPLAGAGFTVSTQAGVRLWEARLDAETVGWLKDHRVGGAVVLPGTAYVEMGLWAATEAFGKEGRYELEEVRFREALVLGESGRRVQVVLTEEGAAQGGFRVSSQGEGETQWTLHASGRVRRVPEESEQVEALETVRARLGQGAPTHGFYEALDAQGLQYGPTFQGVKELWRGSEEALGLIEVPADVVRDSAYRLHPAVLDAALQVVGGAVAGGASSDAGPSLPVLLSRVRVYGELSARMWSYVRVGRDAEGDVADIELRDESGRRVVEVRGLRTAPVGGQRAQRTDTLPLLMQRWRKLEGEPELVAKPGRWLVVLDEGGWGERVARRLEARGQQVHAWKPSSGTSVESALERAFGEEDGRGVVVCPGLDARLEEGSGAEAVLGTQEQLFLHVLALVKALGQKRWRKAPRLWLVTKGAQAVEGGVVSPAPAALWGLGRTIAMEHPELSCTRVDVGDSASEEPLVTRLLAEPSEEELVLHGADTYVARLERAESLPRTERREVAGARTYRLELDAPGALERLTLREHTVRSPGPGEVRVRVEAAGLDLADVLKATGNWPGLAEGPVPLGGECAGTIEALGSGVEGLTVGQRVMTLAPSAFASAVIAPASHVLPLPPGVTVAQAATMPLAHLTAWYALDSVARLRKGERVLIHAAASGVGLAAIQWARHVGAEVFATASTEAERDPLRSLDVRHIADARSDRFVADVLAWTGGQGVDVVLDSVSGDLIAKGFDVLREHGRFIELGKRDALGQAQLGLRPFLKGLSFSLVDVASLLSDRPQQATELLQELARWFERGVLKPLPLQVFPISRAVEAFRTMAEGRHIGKLVVDLTEPEVRIAVGEGASGLKPEASYVVTGGLGGLGLSVARWMVEQGARKLVLVGRAGTETEEQRQQVEELRAHGATVEVCRADVGSEEEVCRAVARAEAMGPLKGVVHAAGVLDDGLLEQQGPEKLRKVMRPKVAGAWNLHRTTSGKGLDFFVMYSSAASLLGSPGQANYAAANAFMDALAEYRKARGLPALSVQWGTFAEVGMAAAQANRGERVAQRGMNSLSPRQGWKALGELLRGDAAQAGVVPLDVRQWVEFYPHLATMARFKDLLRSGSDQPKGEAELVARLRAASAVERPVMMEALVREQAAAVLKLEPSRIEKTTPLKTLGFDSLMGLELRNRLEGKLGVTLSATLAWTYPHVAALTDYLSSLLGPAPEDARSAPAAGPREETASAVERASLHVKQDIDEKVLDELSDDELASLGEQLLGGTRPAGEA
jgi:polyketide synthase 12/epothilone polyketide synthase D